jgi:hypothetical protein
MLTALIFRALWAVGLARPRYLWLPVADRERAATDFALRTMLGRR